MDNLASLSIYCISTIIQIAKSYVLHAAMCIAGIARELLLLIITAEVLTQ